VRFFTSSRPPREATQRHPSFVRDSQSATPHRPRDLAASCSVAARRATERRASLPAAALRRVSSPIHGEREGERERERSPLARAFGAPGQANAGGLAGGAAVSVRPVAGDAADGTAPAAAEEGEEHGCLLLDLLCDGSLARFLRECLASGWTHGSCGLLAFGDLSALKS
jgi:hypothetical protein